MIDINKKYRTRDGREVRIYATDGAMPRPIHGAVKSSYDSTWHSFQWHEDGRLVHNILAVDLSDLIEVRPRHKRTVWLHVWDLCSRLESAADRIEKLEAALREIEDCAMSGSFFEEMARKALEREK